jgi:hypothetical protein
MVESLELTYTAEGEEVEESKTCMAIEESSVRLPKASYTAVACAAAASGLALFNALKPARSETPYNNKNNNME